MMRFGSSYNLVRVMLIVGTVVLSPGRLATAQENMTDDTMLDASSQAHLLASGDFAEYSEWDLVVGDPCDWPGVSCDGNGQITGIRLDSGKARGFSLPAEWGLLKNIRYIVLEDENLIGGLPPEWGELGNLTVISLEENLLTGPLPSEWGNMDGLKWLNLQDNRLSGSLPPEWGGLGKIGHIDLDDNDLSGPLPYSWGNMTSLLDLDLEGNFLEGGLPGTWSNLQNLGFLDLCDNNLSGSVPQGWSSLKDNIILMCTDDEVTGVSNEFDPFPGE